MHLPYLGILVHFVLKASSIMPRCKVLCLSDELVRRSVIGLSGDSDVLEEIDRMPLTFCPLLQLFPLGLVGALLFLALG